MKMLQKSVQPLFCSCVLLSLNSKSFDPKYPIFPRWWENNYLKYNIFTLNQTSDITKQSVTKYDNKTAT